MRKCTIFLVLVLCFAAVCSAQSAQESDPWNQWSFLTGEWVGEGSGEPGQGTGGSSFQFDLQRKVLVRRSFAEYPATKDRPAYRHDDLMVVYSDPKEQKTRAIFLDNEGHVIHYTASVSADGSAIQFVSDPRPMTPRYRLTYFKMGAYRLRFQFEIAPRGSPEKFAMYLQGVLRRKGEAAK